MNVALAMSRPIPLKRYRLGAEELIEMGNARRPASREHRPFLGSRARATMGAEELIEMGDAAPAGKPDVGTYLAVGLVAGIALLAFALG